MAFYPNTSANPFRMHPLLFPAAPPALSFVPWAILAPLVDFAALFAPLIALHLVRVCINRTILRGSHPRTVVDDHVWVSQANRLKPAPHPQGTNAAPRVIPG